MIECWIFQSTVILLYIYDLILLYYYYYRKGLYQWDILLVGAAGDGAAPTVGVLRTHETSRPYK